MPSPEFYRNMLMKKKQNKIKKANQIKNTDSGPVRLNKFVANAGVCSRREADTLIASGKIEVNGKIVRELGTKVMPDDKVIYKGKVLRTEKLIYLLLNKPKDYITTVKDPRERKTVMQLVRNACKERIYPVGRLDRQTTGLLLFTNDGDLAKKLSHPSHNVKKIYQVEIDKGINERDLNALAKGVELEDGQAFADKSAVLSDDKRVLGLEIHIGKNRVVRRMFEHLGYRINKLDRVMFAGLTKKDLPRGRWRFLSEKEVIQLKHLS